MHAHDLLLGVEHRLVGCEHELDAFALEQRAIALERARIAIEVLARQELEPVDEDAHRHRRSVAPRQANQRQVALVQVAHRGNEAEVPGERSPQRRDVAQDLHQPRLKNSRRLRIARSRDTRSSKSGSRSTKFRFSEFTMRSGEAS